MTVPVLESEIEETGESVRERLPWWLLAVPYGPEYEAEDEVDETDEDRTPS